MVVEKAAKEARQADVSDELERPGASARSVSTTAQRAAQVVHQSVSDRLREPVTAQALKLHLLLISFGTGLLDAATYSDFGIFASNQTGNTIIVIVEAINRKQESPAPLLAVGISLASFLAFGVIFGQIGISRFVGPRTRGWLVFSTLAQAVLLLVAAVLVQLNVLSTETRAIKDTTLIILPLAGSSGMQVAMAKSVGVKEVPTAMLTSPYIDLLTDPHLFDRSTRSSNVSSRNLRLAYFTFFASGTVVGAVAKVHSGSKTVLWLSFALRSANVLYILLAAGEGIAKYNGSSPQGDQVAEESSSGADFQTAPPVASDIEMKPNGARHAEQ